MAKAKSKKPAAKKAAATPTSLVTFLLDRSGSMDSIKSATIEAFNAYLSGLQAEKEAKIDFTFLQFDTQSLDKVHVAVPVGQAAALTERSYQPRGGTPLIDAAVKTINAVADSLGKRTDKPRVVVCFQTDGQENSSRDHTWEELKSLIKAKQELGWQFNFMGAGIDAYDQGARMGIATGSTISYDSQDIAATMDAFTSSALLSAGFSAGRLQNTEFSDSMKLAAGDKFAFHPGSSHHKPHTGNVTGGSSILTPGNSPLDLTAGSGPVTPTVKPPRKRGPLEDFSL